MALQSMRRIDDIIPTPQAGARRVDLSGFAGRWVSSDAGSRGIPAFALTVDEQTVRGQFFGAGAQGLVDWGAQPVAQIFTDGVGSSRGAGFALHYDFGFLETRLQVNLKLGVAVLGAFNTFKDGSGRLPYFAREFYAQTPNVTPAAPFAAVPATAPRISRLQDLDFGSAGPDGDVDPALLLGRWRSTVPATGGIAELSLTRPGAAGETVVRILAAGNDDPLDWGKAHARVFTCVEENGIPSICMLADYDFDFMHCALQIRQNKGILAVTSFNAFRDGSGRYDYVTRELFHRLATA